MPQVAASEQNGLWLLRTEHLEVRIADVLAAPSPETLRIIHPMGEWCPGMADPHNLGGTTRILDGSSGDRIRWNRQNKPLPMEPSLLSRSGWAVIDDSSTPVLQEYALAPLPGGKGQGVGVTTDLHFLAYGHDYCAVLQDFTTFAGRIPVPPRYAFGYWWSRYCLYSDAEIRALTQEIASHDLPLDVMVIDMDWHDTRNFSALDLKLDGFGEWEGWTGYSWNRNLFPAPERLLADLHAQGLRISLNLHPASGIPAHEDGYEAFAADYEWDTTERRPIPFRPEDLRWIACYFKHIIEPLERDGVDFWWLDWQQYTHSKTVPGLNMTLWLNRLFVLHARQQGKRPLIFHRWGGLGNHRYQIGFSGDAYCTWESLAYQPQFTAQAANVGYGYWSHDIGGHIAHGPKTDGEMYLRWLQFGILSPMVRTHASKISRIERRLWQFPAQFVAMRQALHLRYELIPYLYHAAFQAWETGLSLCRPMYLHWPEENMAYAVPQQYTLGDNLLAAPITAPADKATGLAEQAVWLPEGGWYDWVRGSAMPASAHPDKGSPAPLQLLSETAGGYTQDEIPLWIRVGSILPMCRGWRDPQQRHQVDTVMVFPDTETLKVLGLEVPEKMAGVSRASTFAGWQPVWVEDDGETEGYVQGDYLRMEMKQEVQSHSLSVYWRRSAQGNGKHSMERRIRFVFPGLGMPNRVISGGEALQVTYEAARMAVVVEGVLVSAEMPGSLELHWEMAVNEQFALTSGLPGQFRRTQAVVERLKTEVAKKDWGGTLPDVLHRVAGTPTRIGYAPETALAEAAAFPERLIAFREEIRTLPTISEAVRAWALARI